MKINPVLLNWASLLVFMVFGALYSCTSTGSASATPSKEDIPYTSLLDRLRREPQLTISGSDLNPIIRIRGSRSIEGNNEPLFVLDGTPLGYGYANARSIDVNEVHSIRVLSASQAGLYGSRGANGVIQIKTKQ
jgi:outer membrane cobalamin receptor